MHGKTEGEKRWISKETGPVTADLTVTKVLKNKVAAADPHIQ